MDTLPRLIARLLPAFLLVVAGLSARAQVPEQCFLYSATYVTKSGSGSTRDAACSDLAGKMSGTTQGGQPGNFTTNALVGTVNGGSCTMTGTSTFCQPSGCTTSPLTVSVTIASTPITCDSSCQTKTGQPGATPGTSVFSYDGGNGASPRFATQGCHAGCMLDLSKSIQGADRAPGGSWQVQVDVSQGTHTGSNCQPSATVPDTANPPTRPRGTCPGTVNGTPVDVPCTESGAKDTKTQVTTAPNGSTTVTTTTTNTTCNGAGACSSTTTTVGPGGATTTTTTDTKSGHCADDPGSPVCGSGTGGNGDGDGEEEDPSAFGGACGSFSCTGDAIQCAIAREQHQRNCALFDTATSISDIGTNAATGQDPQDHPKNHAEQIAVDLAATISSVPMFGGSGGCPQDVSLSVQGHSLSFPFSSLCPYLQLLGAAFLAACYLSAAFIVFKRD